jgi:hypothetical protein
LDGLSIGQHKAICASEKKEKMQDSIIENLKGQIKEFQTKVGLQEGEVAEKDSRVKNLESENEKLVGAILKLGDVRTVVNRVWDKEDNSQKVVNRLKNEDYLPQFDQGSSQYGSQANMRYFLMLVIHLGLCREIIKATPVVIMSISRGVIMLGMISGIMNRMEETLGKSSSQCLTSMRVR